MSTAPKRIKEPGVETGTNSELPAGWASTTLGEIVTSQKGKKPQVVLEEPKQGYIPYIDIEAFETGQHRRYGESASSVRVCKGELVIVWDGARSGLVGAVPFAGALGSTLAVLKSSTLYTPFLQRFLGSCYGEINSNHRGTGIPHVDPDFFWTLSIPLAPVKEQERIATQVGYLLDKVTASRKNLTKVYLVLKHFRQAVLTAACSGRLTEDWRRQNGTSDEHLSSTVGEIADYVGGFAYKSPTFLKSGDHQVIRIGNVRPFHLDLNTSPVYIPRAISDATARFKLQPNDIVISMTGTKFKKDYGFAALVPGNATPLYLNQRVARLRCKTKIVPRYLLFWLQTDAFRDFFFEGETGNVNQGNVGADGLRKAPIELPSLPEQHEIVRRVEELFKLADAIEKRVAAATLRAERLTQAVLAKAFRGELVPTEAELARREGRGYEPASVLLERIKAERQKAAEQSVTRKKKPK